MDSSCHHHLLQHETDIAIEEHYTYTPKLEKLLRGQINTKIVPENYDDVFRLAYSIREALLRGLKFHFM